MAPRWRLVLCAITSLTMASIVDAQQIAVQQPVVQNFSASTSVSVPDRGSAHLGSVGSASSGRSVSGPFRSGTSRGQDRQASSTSVHVYIHDFEAMDAALLATPTKATSSKLDSRITQRLEQRSSTANSAGTSVLALDVMADAERLAEQAEARGKFVVAKLHWQRAARHGSRLAAQRLAETSTAKSR